MKRNCKSFLALCLSASMLVSPLSYTKAYASEETDIMESSSQNEIVAETENKSENQSPSSEETGSVSGQENDNTSKETDVTEDTESDVPNQQTSQQNAEVGQAQNEAQQEVADTEMPAAPTAAITGVTVVKSDGSSYGMFPIGVTKMEVNGDNIEIAFNTKAKTNYDKLYLGAYTDEQMSKIYSGNNTGSTVEFSIEVPVSKKNTWIPIAIGKTSTNDWKEEYLWMSIPDPSAPVITDQPKSKTEKSGETVTLSVKASGDNLSYQWQYSADGTIWNNCNGQEAKKAEYSFTMSENLAGQYRCMIQNQLGADVVSDAVKVALQEETGKDDQKPSVITIKTQPKDVSAKLNKNVTLSIAAETDAEGTLSYQWQYSEDGTAWTDCTELSAKTAEYTFTLTDKTVGKYHCVVNDASGTKVESDLVNVTELKAPSVTGSKVKVVKADGTDFKMFIVSESKAQKDGDTLEVTFATTNTSFDKVYLGEKEDEIRNAVKGSQIEKDGKMLWTFTIEVPSSDMGKVLPITLGKLDGTWYTGQDLWIYIPDEGVTDIPISEGEVKAIAGGTGDAYGDFTVVSSKAVLRGETITMSLGVKGNKWTKLYQGVQADNDKSDYVSGSYDADTNETTFTFTIPASKQGMNIAVTPGNDTGWFTYARDLFINVPNLEEKANTTENGTYELYGSAYPTSRHASLNFERGSRVKINGDTATVTMITQAGSYDKIYIGNVSDLDTDKDAKAVTATDRSDIASGYKCFTFTIPTADLGKEIQYVVHVSKDNKWAVKQSSFYINGILDMAEDQPTPDPDPTPDPVIPSDGTYTIDVDSSNSMFRVVACKLIVKNGKMTAVLTLSGTGYDYLYVGTTAKDEDEVKTEVENADSKSWVPFVADSNGKYTYTIPVESLDRGIAVAAFSHKKQSWFGRLLTFKSETLQKVGDGGSTNPSDSSKPSGNNGNSGASKPNDGKADQESKWEADTSGSTSAINSSTTLADGVYTPDRFSWSGGTGKVKITCNKVTIQNGQAYATLVFDSDHYQYVKANGRTYYTTKGSGMATVVIPIALNQNNTILGMTDKMSVAHEVAYTIFVYLAAAGNGKGAGIVQNKTLDDEAPEIMGLNYESETKLEHAEYFKIYHYDKGITLLEVDVTKDTVRDPEKVEDSDKKDTDSTTDADQAEDASKEQIDSTKESDTEQTSGAADSAEDGEVAASEAEQAAELYKGNVIKYLLVPENTVIPVGLSEDMIVVQMPADKAYVSDNEILKQMEELDLLDQVTAVGMKKKNCKVSDIADKMSKKKGEKQAEVIYGGKETDPKFRKLVKQEVNLSLVSSDLLPAEDKTTKKGKIITEEDQIEQWEKITEKYALLGIPMIVDRSADEKDDLAKAEWIKVYGVIFGCEDQANALYEEVVQQAGEK